MGGGTPQRKGVPLYDDFSDINLNDRVCRASRFDYKYKKITHPDTFDG